jgi:hypothetical protein
MHFAASSRDLFNFWVRLACDISFITVDATTFQLKKNMPVNIALIVVTSVISVLSLGCIICHEVQRRKTGLNPEGRGFSHEGHHNLQRRYHKREELREEQRRNMHDSWRVRNPASVRVRSVKTPTVSSRTSSTHSSVHMRA